MEIEEKVLGLIKSNSEGILQNEIWKAADIDRRKCSRIVAKLEKLGKIRREPENEKGSRTNRIKYVLKDEKIRDFRVLLVRGIISPCTDCAIECEPEKCEYLTDWVRGLNEEIK